ncbi:MAG TPA: hypothetical protein VJ715_11085 [Pyrinomonadaceae bacterium]|nr:hypothetical protein [Pyrinomonadaceae bacterium]
MTKRSFGRPLAARHGERGAARLKFIIVLVVIAAVGYMAFQYIPVAYQASRYKTRMQDVVTEAAAAGKGTEWVRSQLEASAAENSVPEDAKIVPAIQEGRMTVTVQFTRPVNLLPGFTYNYNFEHTAKSADLLTIK